MSRKKRWPGILAALPAVAASAAPVGVCPVCWPVYAGLLSALGLGPLLERAWMLPLTAALLGGAVAALVWRARSRRGYAPALLGAVAAIAILAGKFIFESVPVTWVGVAGLVAASVFNAWPRRSKHGGACPCTVPAGRALPTINDPGRRNNGGSS